MANVMAGSIVTLSHTFTTANALSPTSVMVIVNKPDGTTANPSGSISNTLIQNPTATATISFSVAGPYVIYWQMITSDGETIIEQDDYFAPYTMVHRFVRERLSATTLTLPDAPLDSTLCFVTRLVIQRLALLSAYNAIPSVDQIAFDQALALTVAAYLRPLTPKTFASGELTGIQIGTDKWSFSDMTKRASVPLDTVELQWINQADEILLSCSFAQPDDNSLINMPHFQIAGSRRYARAELNYPESTTPLYQLWGDIATQWAWERATTNAWM